MGTTVKKGITLHYILIFVLIVSASQTAFAQFAFEIPKRNAENFIAYSLEAISVNVSGKLALRSHAEKGTILLDVRGGKAPYTFRWNTLETTKDRSNLNAGTYTVDITDAEGEKHSERIVIQPPYSVKVLDMSNSEVTVSFEIDHVQSQPCASQSDDEINLRVSDGITPNRNKGMFGSTLKKLNGIAASDYQVLITDQKGILHAYLTQDADGQRGRPWFRQSAQDN